LREQPALLVGHVLADLPHQPAEHVVETGVAGVDALQFLHGPLGRGMVGDLLVGDPVAAGQVPAHRRVEVLLLGDRVPHQLDDHLVGQLPPGPGVGGRDPVEPVEQLLHPAMVVRQDSDHVALPALHASSLQPMAAALPAAGDGKRPGPPAGRA
jgi:hypothetical protein